MNIQTWLLPSKASCVFSLILINSERHARHPTGLSKYNKTTQPGDFWTSGTDAGCESAHGWCSVNKLFRETKWAPGQPDNLGGKENCVAVSVENKAALLKDETCIQKFRYICEVTKSKFTNY